MNQKYLLILSLAVFFVASIALTWYIATKWKISANVAPVATTTKTATTEPASTTQTNVAVNTTAELVNLILQPGFNLKTIPYYLAPSDGKNIFSQLKSSEAFILIGEKWSSLLETGSLSPGQGVIIKSGEGEVYKLPVSATKVDETKPFTIHLKTGWNAIGNPFSFDVKWNPIIKVAQGSTTFAKATEAHILSGAKRYSAAGKEYEDIATDSAWKTFEGLLSKSGGEMDLIIDPTLKP